MKKIITALLALLPLFAVAQGGDERPKLVVNIVVGGLSYDILDKYRGNLSDEGFIRFASGGLDYREAYYGHSQTLSPVGIATLTTGVDPSMHGVVAGEWVDYVTGWRTSLIADSSVQGLDTETGGGRYSARNLVMPTLGDELLAASPESKVISVAAEPISAIVAGGQRGKAFWMDGARATWTTSTAYMFRLPDWVTAYNVAHTANNYIELGWTPARMMNQYISGSTEIFRKEASILQKAAAVFGGANSAARITTFRNGEVNDYAAMLKSPHGNTLVADFARRVVQNERLGADDAPDMLYVCFDASREIGRRYGAGSMEVEDMIYRLDYDLGAMVDGIVSLVGKDEVLFVLTADHGLGEAWDAGSVERDRFNVSQFKTLMNSFLSAQFGESNLMLDYIDRQVYFDHNLIYRKNLSLEEVQNRAASFALQFRGVSHVLTATALGGGYFGSGYGEKIQRSFYPRRGGDLMLNFMPGWIEERAETRSLSGSMYAHDTHVPLMLFGWKIRQGAVITDRVDMTRVAPTLARVLGIGLTASDATELPEVIVAK